MENNLHNEIEKLRSENENLRNQVNETSEKKRRKQEKTKKTLTWTWKLFTGKSLNKNFNQWFLEYHSEKKVAPDTSANLLTALVSRFVRVRTLSLILLLFSLIPSLISLWVLMKQNSLIKNQNSLVEASRKSSYGFQLTNVFDAVDKHGYSSSLKARIVGLSHSLKPYKILLENDELSKKMYSPERSQLLLFLINSNISQNNLRNIFNSADFTHCDLKGMDLSGRYMGGVNLANSNLENVNFTKANLSGANLTNTNINNSKLHTCIAKKTNFKKATLINSDIRYADLTGANIIESNLNSANLDFSVLKGVCFTDAEMDNTNLNGANLQNAYFKGSFNLNIDSDSKARGNLSEIYIEKSYTTKHDDDDFDTFIKK